MKMARQRWRNNGADSVAIWLISSMAGGVMAGSKAAGGEGGSISGIAGVSNIWLESAGEAWRQPGAGGIMAKAQWRRK